jgi:AcrR family transcriptional regulator
MPDSPRTYGGVDGSARVAERRRILIETGLDLLGTAKPDLTVRGVCRRAGVVSRYFYESFADRDALMVAVYDHVVDDVAAIALDAVAAAPKDDRERVHAGIRAIVRAVAEDPRRGFLLFSATTVGDILVAKRAESTKMFAHLLATQATEFYGTTRDHDLDLTTHFVVGGFAQVLTAWLGGELELSEDAVVDRCAELLLATSPVKPPHP